MNPQRRPRSFPIPEGAALGEPQRRAFVVSIARNIKIYRRIGRAKPVCSLVKAARTKCTNEITHELDFQCRLLAVVLSSHHLYISDVQYNVGQRSRMITRRR